MVARLPPIGARSHDKPCIIVHNVRNRILGIIMSSFRVMVDNSRLHDDTFMSLGAVVGTDQCSCYRTLSIADTCQLGGIIRHAAGAMIR